METQELYASVCVDSTSPALEETYTYRVPSGLREFLSVGSRVAVTFASRPALGYVLSLDTKTSYDGEIKEIDDILDFHRDLSDEQIALARFISSDTLTPLSTVLRSLFPSFLRTSYRRTVTDIDYAVLDPDLVMLFRHEKTVTITASMKPMLARIRREEQRGHLRIGHDLSRYGKNYAEKAWRLSDSPARASVLSEARRAVIDYLTVHADGTMDEIRTATGCSEYLVRTLAKEGQLVEGERLPAIEVHAEKRFRPFLHDHDDERLATLFHDKASLSQPFLLTGNDDFRARFILERSREVIAQGKSVLIASPSIIKNEEMKKLFLRNSKNLLVASFSSCVKTSEFYRDYLACEAGAADVIFTTPIGFGLPFQNLGLVVMTDEDSPNYISETTPKTDGASVLAFRARHHDAPFILSSPAPSIERGYQAFRANVTLIAAAEQANPVTFVSLKDQPASDALVSPALAQAMRENLERGGMTLLILNAVGYSHELLCRSCGEILRCPKCKAPLYYYKEKNLLKCNRCDYRSVGLSCPSCGGKDIIPLGPGLEKLAETVSGLFPTATIARMDYTLASSRESYENFLLSLEDAKAPIVIGSASLLALSDPRLSLVGIIASDAALGMPSYRAAETAYGLIARGALKKNVKLIVQGYDLDHFAIRTGSVADYTAFFNEEIRVRRALDYPPFTSLLSFTIHGPFDAMFHAANYLKKALGALVHGSIIGPSYSREKKGLVLEVRHDGDLSRIVKLYQDVAKKFQPERVVLDYTRHVR